MTTTELTTKDVSIRAGELTLRGTLTVPTGEGPFPGALLVVGSGEVNRDSDHRKLPLGVTRLLARHLADAGVASLRFDKRGVGESEGDFLSAGLQDNIADAKAALATLRDDVDIDADNLLVIGHSEGAFITVAIGADEDVAGVALLSGGVRTGEETLRWQAAALVPTLPPVVRGLLRILRVDVFAKQAKTFAKLRASSEDVVRISGTRHNARWFREFLDFDPRPLLARIDAPVLAITGAKDLQSPPEDVAAMREVVAGPVEGHVVDDVNHILRLEPGRPDIRHYKRQVTEPLDGRVVELLTSWTRAVTTRTTPP